jgi:uncharacterized protein (DUF58 family)
MTRRASPRLGAYAGLAALGLLTALVLGLPELVVLAAPFALLLAAGLALGAPPRLELRASFERERALEGEELTATVTVSSETAVERVEVLLVLPFGLEAEPEANPVALRLAPGDEHTLELAVRCARWGGYAPGELAVRAHDRLGLFRFEAFYDRRVPLRVYPQPEPLLSLLRPLETQVFAGNQVARAKGDGIEFADMRPFVPGDRPRRVNWRASARRGELVVNEHHPEKNTDVILFLDSFVEARGEEAGTLDLTVRAAAALAESYLQRKDRVGIVGFGGILRWLLPGTGLVQLYRVLDALIDTEVVLNFAWKDLDVLPARTLPPKALVIALTPLLDDRALGALLDLRARGFDLAVVEVSPIPFTAEGTDESEQLAYRIWRHRRAALRHRFERAGVAVTEWRDGDPLAAGLEEVGAYRRRARIARA